MLSDREQTLALAESCTGGFLADQITNVPGASKVFVAGYVTYSNEEKIRALGVSRESIERFGAVSEQVAIEMAEGLRTRTGVTHGIATTGIAGPGGGSEEKPVGTAFLGLSSENQPARWEKFFFPSDRGTFKQLVAQRAFDIRQGLRTFSTSFFQAPGRLNLVDVGGVRVFIDYCHNVDGMRQLADFVTRMMVEAPTKSGRVGAASTGSRTGRAIGILGIPGDRRDEDQRQYGAIAAGAFDELIVREDANLRGRAPGETATNVIEGIRQARASGSARASRADKVLDEMTAVKTALRRAIPGDLVVCCVDDAVGVYRAAMAAAGTSRGGTAFADPGELEAPEG